MSALEVSIAAIMLAFPVTSFGLVVIMLVRDYREARDHKRFFSLLDKYKLRFGEDMARSFLFNFSVSLLSYKDGAEVLEKLLVKHSAK